MLGLVLLEEMPSIIFYSRFVSSPPFFSPLFCVFTYKKIWVRLDLPNSGPYFLTTVGGPRCLTRRHHSNPKNLTYWSNRVSGSIDQNARWIITNACTLCTYSVAFTFQSVKRDLRYAIISRSLLGLPTLILRISEPPSF